MTHGSVQTLSDTLAGKLKPMLKQEGESANSSLAHASAKSVLQLQKTLTKDVCSGLSSVMFSPQFISHVVQQLEWWTWKT